MKNTLLLFFAFSLSGECLFARAPFNTMDSVNINNINASVLVHGDMFRNPSDQKQLCEFPKGSGKHLSLGGALWMTGFDNGGDLHVAAQTYRQFGNDYWPGPLDNAGALTYAVSANWAKIWKVNETDIQYFQSLTTHNTTNTPNAILTWPGKGNVYAAGNGGVALSISNDMAPFIDLNGNGIYEPLLGEYPAIKGDQALWQVFSDNGPAHSESNGRPFGVEIHSMAYAYNRGTLIDNVIYFDYRIINRSPNTYHNFRIGIWDDMDLGNPYDDYMGFDSTWRMGIVYNSSNYDTVYGNKIPVAGITMIVSPGDTGTSYIPAGSFTVYFNDFSLIGNPHGDSQFNFYLRSRIRDGQYLYSYTTSSNHCKDHDSTRFYVVSGDPRDTTQCSECAFNNSPGDERFIITTNDFTLYPDSMQHMVMALVTTSPDTLNACPNASFDSIKIVADTAWTNYHHPPAPLRPNAIKNLTSGNDVNIYPNPAHNQVIIETTLAPTTEETITFYNIIGQKVNVNIARSGSKKVADIGNLPNGIYMVIYNNGTIQKTVKVIKE